MNAYPTSEILITVLRSTSFLLKHYDYDGHNPSLSELQQTLGRAMTQLEAHAQHESNNTVEALIHNSRGVNPNGYLS